MINVVHGYRCMSIVHRPKTRDWLIVLATAQGIPFNLVCTQGQKRLFQIGRLYDFLVHPENFRAQRIVPPAALRAVPQAIASAAKAAPLETASGAPT